ncbi:class I SAM-dependent methyltransferase [Actinoplanes sp. NPDC051494]|uniref:class I SAM-dependent methyltransferase n=1 Tax=Actinoplanes sp. NPDC051494 TaxID=3363907 RepID=UPI0037BC6936
MDELRRVYDTVAVAYDERLRDELDHKPLDRALLTATVELAGTGPAGGGPAGRGTVADVGCGPGQVTRFLAALHPDVVGVDLSPAMVALARDRSPDIPYLVASMLELPVGDDAWSGAVALYSIIHLDPVRRRAAFRELARVLRPEAPLLIAFHTASSEVATGGTLHLTSWFGADVTVDVHFLDPVAVRADLGAAGFDVVAEMYREALDPEEYPSRRAYLLARAGRA